MQLSTYREAPRPVQAELEPVYQPTKVKANWQTRLAEAWIIIKRSPAVFKKALMLAAMVSFTGSLLLTWQVVQPDQQDINRLQELEARFSLVDNEPEGSSQN
jgi:hypothetical protein